MRARPAPRCGPSRSPWCTRSRRSGCAPSCVAIPASARASTARCACSSCTAWRAPTRWSPCRRPPRHPRPATRSPRGCWTPWSWQVHASSGSCSARDGRRRRSSPNMGEEREIFRRESLERLSSPERLDQLLYVVKPQLWLFLACTAALLCLFALWSVLGRIPVSADGAAILVRPKKVVGFQSRSQGQVQSLAVDVGHVVHKGDLLATLRLNDLEKELELEQSKLELFRSH